MFSRPFWTLVLAWALPAGASSPSLEQWQASAVPKQPIRIVRHLRANDDGGDLVVLNQGHNAGILVGTHLKVMRQAPSRRGQAGDPIWVDMGRIRTIDVQDDVTIARIESEASPVAKAFFPRYATIMAGDLAVERNITVARTQVAAPTVAVGYHELFVDPKRLPGSFELSPEGYDKLRELAGRFASMRLSMLMIEGYTDHHGSSEQNQVESYQRALTVRQFLVDELGFDEKRVVAVGYGENEPADRSMVPGYIEANRRIVLKAVVVVRK